MPSTDEKLIPVWKGRHSAPFHCSARFLVADTLLVTCFGHACRSVEEGLKGLVWRCKCMECFSVVSGVKVKERSSLLLVCTLVKHFSLCVHPTHTHCIIKHLGCDCVGLLNNIRSKNVNTVQIQGCDLKAVLHIVTSFFRFLVLSNSTTFDRLVSQSVDQVRLLWH